MLEKRWERDTRELSAFRGILVFCLHAIFLLFLFLVFLHFSLPSHSFHVNRNSLEPVAHSNIYDCKISCFKLHFFLCKIPTECQLEMGHKHTHTQMCTNISLVAHFIFPITLPVRLSCESFSWIVKLHDGKTQMHSNKCATVHQIKWCLTFLLLFVAIRSKYIFLTALFLQKISHDICCVFVIAFVVRAFWQCSVRWCVRMFLRDDDFSFPRSFSFIWFSC